MVLALVTYLLEKVGLKDNIAVQWFGCALLIIAFLEDLALINLIWRIAQ